jgi:N-formylglutamate deformylase
MISIEPGVFLRFDPATGEIPLLVDVSRSGREYPKEFRSPLPFTVLHDNVSMYVEDLYAAAPSLGATLLSCCFPNTFIDVNRSELDIDPDLIDGQWPVPLKPTAIGKRGLGLLKTKSRYGEPLQEKKLTVAEVEERLKNYYRPYHVELKRIIDYLHGRFGFLRQLSCHCMSAIGAPTHGDPGQPRPDFCIGDVGGTTSSPEFVKLVVETLKGFGYSVKVNDPYSGAELNTRYGDPKRGIDSIMIEINKKLFMDINTFRKTPGFARVKADLDKLLSVLAADTKERIKPGK